MKYAIGICVAFAVAPVAHAGAVIDLVPVEPGPYAPGQRVELNVSLTQEPRGEDIYLRLLQLDFADTDPALTLDEMFRFDYSGQAVCVQIPALCGTSHAEFPVLTTPHNMSGDIFDGNLVAVIYIGTRHSPYEQIRLPGLGAVTIGSIGVTLPTQSGVYLVDVLNADTERTSSGARIDFGFGTSPSDPITTWRTFDEGQNAGGRFMAGRIAGAGFQFEYSPIPGVITPEPASLALLALGGLMAIRRRTC